MHPSAFFNKCELIISYLDDELISCVWNAHTKIKAVTAEIFSFLVALCP